jgi:hypothetical protein
VDDSDLLLLVVVVVVLMLDSDFAVVSALDSTLLLVFAVVRSWTPSATTANERANLAILVFLPKADILAIIRRPTEVGFLVK